MKRWPQYNAYFWETAPFFRALLPFATGIVCYDRQWLPAYSEPVYFAILTTALISTLIAGLSKALTPALRGVYLLSISVFLFFAGYSVSWHNDIRNSSAWFGHQLEHTKTHLARVTGDPLEKEHSWKVPVSILATINDSSAMPAVGAALVYLYKDSAATLPHIGDTILLPNAWKPVRNAGNPFEFDYSEYCRRNNIVYQQFCSPAHITTYRKANISAFGLTQKAHTWCMQQLEHYMPDPKARGLMQAMLLGDEQNLDAGIRQSYSETGIVHIIAISGGNVEIFYIAISFLLFWLGNSKYKWVKYSIALPLVWFYVLMAGAPPSAIRAAVMFSLVAVGLAFQKNGDSLNQLLAAAFILLWAQPMWLFAVGFQLSFVAVLSLVLFYNAVAAWWRPNNILLKNFWSTIAASLAAEILVAPVVIYYFHTFPVLFLVANVAAFIFMFLALILGISIVVLAAFVPLAAGAAGSGATALINSFDRMVSAMQGFNPTSFRFLQLHTIELILLFLFIAGMATYLIRIRKAALFTGLGAACLLTILLCNDQYERLKQDRLVAYHTGTANHIELVCGSGYRVIYTDSVSNSSIAYATTAAHTGWQAWQADTGRERDIVFVSGKTILVLDSIPNSNSPFPVDYVIVLNAHNDPAKLQRVFSPRLMVMGNNFSKWEQEKWRYLCGKEQINLFNPAINGAFEIH